MCAWVTRPGLLRLAKDPASLSAKARLHWIEWIVLLLVGVLQHFPDSLGIGLLLPDEIHDDLCVTRLCLFERRPSPAIVVMEDFARFTEQVRQMRVPVENHSFPEDGRPVPKEIVVGSEKHGGNPQKFGEGFGHFPFVARRLVPHRPFHEISARHRLAVLIEDVVMAIEVHGRVPPIVSRCRFKLTTPKLSRNGRWCALSSPAAL